MKTKKTFIREERSLEYLRSMMKSSEIASLVKKGAKSFYIYSVYPVGGGDDQIELACFAGRLDEDQFQKVFNRKRGDVMLQIIEVNI